MYIPCIILADYSESLSYTCSLEEGSVSYQWHLSLRSYINMKTNSWKERSIVYKLWKSYLVFNFQMLCPYRWEFFSHIFLKLITCFLTEEGIMSFGHSAHYGQLHFFIIPWSCFCGIFIWWFPTPPSFLPLHPLITPA